jgi:hypothetical protein
MKSDINYTQLPARYQYQCEVYAAAFLQSVKLAIFNCFKCYRRSAILSILKLGIKIKMRNLLHVVMLNVEVP